MSHQSMVKAAPRQPASSLTGRIMANNRMYLVNKLTGEKVSIAKYYPSTGWFCPQDLGEKLNDFFDAQDFGHLTAEEREAKAKQTDFCPPYAFGWTNGTNWELAFETND